MRSLMIEELDYVAGGKKKPDAGVLTPAETHGLTDAEAGALLGYIALLGSVVDPLESADILRASFEGYNAVELEKETMAMKMYCVDHEQGWKPGPKGTPGVCVD